MADSIRQKIVSAIDTRLKTILVSGGFETDAGNNVFEERKEPLEEAKLPALIYRDTNDPIDGQHDKDAHRLNVGIEGVVVGSAAPSDLRKLLADIVVAIGVDRTWGGLAWRTNLVGENIDYEKDSRRIGGVLVNIEVLYDTNIFDPYTQ